VRQRWRVKSYSGLDAVQKLQLVPWYIGAGLLSPSTECWNASYACVCVSEYVFLSVRYLLLTASHFLSVPVVLAYLLQELGFCCACINRSFQRY